jgi:hypothetical protein
MNFALQLTQNRVAGVKIDLSRFFDKPANIARSVLFVDPSPQTMGSIDKAVAVQADTPNAATPATVAGLVIGSPDFQRR